MANDVAVTEFRGEENDCIKMNLLTAQQDVAILERDLMQLQSGVMSFNLDNIPDVIAQPTTFNIMGGTTIIGSGTSTYATRSDLLDAVVLAINNAGYGYIATASDPTITVQVTNSQYASVILSIQISSFVIVNPQTGGSGETYSFTVTAAGGCSAIIYNEADFSLWIFSDTECGFSRVQGLTQIENVSIPLSSGNTTSAAFYNPFNKHIYRRVFNFNSMGEALVIYDGDPLSLTYKQILDTQYITEITAILGVNPFTHETCILTTDGANQFIKFIATDDTETGSIIFPFATEFGIATGSNIAAFDPQTGKMYVTGGADDVMRMFDGVARTFTGNVSIFPYTGMSSCFYRNISGTGYIYVECSGGVIKCDLSLVATGTGTLSGGSGGIETGTFTGNHFSTTDEFFFVVQNASTGTTEFNFPHFIPGAIFYLQAVATSDGWFIYCPYQQSNEVLLLQIIDNTYRYAASTPTSQVSGTCLTETERNKIIYDLSTFCSQCLDCIGAGESFEVINVIAGDIPNSFLGQNPIQA